ncbi:MAG: hypothetical protein ACE5DQ_02235, partial [Candidatus Paceibacterota bacterium]
MSKLLKWLKIVDDNILVILLSLFAFVIPLYPKIPLFVVNFTHVAIRIEDYFVAVLTTIFIIQLTRRKVSIPVKFVIPFLVFWAIAFLSYYV